LEAKKVTDLRVGARDENRVNVFLDNKFAFSLTIAQVSDFKLKRGTILTESEISEIQKASDFGKLFQRSLEYALSRPHSEKEIRDYLKRKKMKHEIEQKRYDSFLERLKNDADYATYVKELRSNVREKNKKLLDKDFTEDNRFEYVKRASTGLPTKPGAAISEEDIDAVISKLIDLKIIDDESFARYFVENRNQIKGTSEKKLRMELRNKGISDTIIASVLSEDEFGDKVRDDRTEILKMIEKKRRRGYDDAKLTQYLARQGFSYDLIRESLTSPHSE
jgi:regulatory protein